MLAFQCIIHRALGNNSSCHKYIFKVNPLVVFVYIAHAVYGRDPEKEQC